MQQHQQQPNTTTTTIVRHAIPDLHSATAKLFELRKAHLHAMLKTNFVLVSTRQDSMEELQVVVNTATERDDEVPLPITITLKHNRPDADIVANTVKDDAGMPKRLRCERDERLDRSLLREIRLTRTLQRCEKLFQQKTTRPISLCRTYLDGLELQWEVGPTNKRRVSYLTMEMDRKACDGLGNFHLCLRSSIETTNPAIAIVNSLWSTLADIDDNVLLPGLGLIHDVDVLSCALTLPDAVILALTPRLFHVVLDAPDPDAVMDVALDGTGGVMGLRCNEKLSDMLVSAGALKAEAITTVDDLKDCFEQFSETRQRVPLPPLSSSRKT